MGRAKRQMDVSGSCFWLKTDQIWEVTQITCEMVHVDSKARRSGNIAIGELQCFSGQKTVILPVLIPVLWKYLGSNMGTCRCIRGCFVRRKHERYWH